MEEVLLFMNALFCLYISPHRYIVKPHRGQIVGNGTTAVNVTLLPFHYNTNDKFNDKFLLQVS
jgi:hypothetical protein